MPIPADVSFEAIAKIRSCFTQRFGIPRQAGLVPGATAQIVFTNTPDNLLSLRGLDEFSHLWVIFVFHKQHYKKAKPLVTPPRLGGKKTMGVFATRSPNRPNPIGMSAVEIEKITCEGNEILVHVNGGDFLDGTPVLDIKPYVSFADAIPEASSSWVSPIGELLPVKWCEPAINGLHHTLESDDQTQLSSIIKLINETIAQDPRPAYERNKDGHTNQQWHMRLMDLDISWSVINGTAEIIKVKPYSPPGT